MRRRSAPIGRSQAITACTVAVLGAAVLALSLGLSQSGDSQPETGAPAASAAAPRPRGPQAHVNRRVNSIYEGINLNRDGTYDRTVVDRWGRAYQHRGTWRGYGGTYATGRSRVSRQLELDSYTEARDLINSGAQKAPKSTKHLSSGDFYME